MKNRLNKKLFQKNIFWKSLMKPKNHEYIAVQQHYIRRKTRTNKQKKNYWKYLKYKRLISIYFALVYENVIVTDLQERNMKWLSFAIHLPQNCKGQVLLFLSKLLCIRTQNIAEIKVPNLLIFIHMENILFYHCDTLLRVQSLVIISSVCCTTPIFILEWI